MSPFDRVIAIKARGDGLMAESNRIAVTMKHKIGTHTATKEEIEFAIDLVEEIGNELQALSIAIKEITL